VRPEVGRVETEVGDSDPVHAIEDALRQFPADEVIVVTRPSNDAGWREKDSAAEARNASACRSATLSQVTAKVTSAGR
jgi:hypothetical protein